VGITTTMAAFELRVPPLRTSVGDARRALAAWLVGCGISTGATELPTLVVSELVSNGVVHGNEHEIAIWADLDGCGLLCLDVVTHDPRRGTVPTALPPGEATGGRGLGIVISCCEEVTIRRVPDGHRVTCTMRLTDCR